jgi:RNase H-fold protein (predicted Holliday junction resolvase)
VTSLSGSDADAPPVAFPAVVLAVDPGSRKCGVAVVRREREGDRPTPLHREVVERERLVARVLPLVSAHHVEAVLVGDATGGSVLARALRAALPAGVAVYPVDEAFTSQRARRRYFGDNPPRGLGRLVPAGFRTPPRPYDDYVAVILAEDFFAASLTGERPAPGP